MTAPETTLTDNGKSFLSQTFSELLDELDGKGSGTISLTRGDGGALALMTTDRNMIEIITGLVEQATPRSEESGNAEASEEANHDGE